MLEVIRIPGCNYQIKAGNIVKLGRYDSERWEVGYGWYAWGGNRPVCGWYLTNVITRTVKPLQLTDLEDIYVVECCHGG